MVDACGAKLAVGPQLVIFKKFESLIYDFLSQNVHEVNKTIKLHHSYFLVSFVVLNVNMGAHK